MPGEDVIQFFCVSCGHKYRVPRTVAGKKSRCKQCGTEMRVPDAPPPGPPKPAAPKPIAPESAALKPVDDDDEPIGLAEDDADTPGRGIASIPRTNRGKPKPTPQRPGKPSAGRKQAAGAQPAKPGRTEPARRSESGDAAKRDKKPTAQAGGESPDTSADAKWAAMLEQAAPAKPQPITQPAEQSQADTPTDAALAFSPTARPRSTGGGKEGFVAGLTSIQHALTSAFSGSETGKAPLSRRISFGGGFILVASVAALILSVTLDSEVSPASVLGERFSDGTLRQVATFSPAAVSGMVVGSVGLVAGLLLIGWRFMVPREEAESPLVLLSFAGFVLMTIVTGVAILFAPGTVGLTLSTVFGVAILAGAFVFGGWMLYRLNLEADGNGIMLLLVPALLYPTAGVLGLLYRANARAQEYGVPMQWGEVNWGRLLLVWLITAVVMFVMGGFVGVWALLAVPLFLLAASESSAGFSLGWGAMVTLVCVLCYLWLFVTRWRVVFKPVGWQFAVLIFGLAVAGNYYAAADYKKPLDSPQVVVTGDVDRGRSSSGGRHGDRPERTSASVNNGEVILTTLQEVQAYGLANGIQINRLDDGQFEQATIPGHEASQTSQRYFYRGTDLLPPPGPALPDFPRGVESPGTTPVASWPVFEVPEPNRIEGGEWLYLGGYRFHVPPGCSVREVDNGYFRIRAEIQVDGVGVDDALLTLDFKIRNPSSPGRGFEPFSRRSRSAMENYESDQVEYGLLSGQPFIRAERYPFPRGIVLFYFQHSDRSDYAFNVSYKYDVRQPEVASIFEAIVRSLDAPGEVEYLDAAQPEVAAHAPEASHLIVADQANPQTAQYFHRALILPEHPSITLPNYHDQDEVSAHIIEWRGGEPSENQEVIRISIRPGHQLDAGHNLFQVQGFSELWGFQDETIRAAGAPFTLHRMWGGAVFVRFDRGLTSVSRRHDQTIFRQRIVTYAGYLNGFQIKINIIDLENRGLSMEELETYVRTIRLPTEQEAREKLDGRRHGSRVLRDWVEAGQVDILTLEGTLMSSIYAAEGGGGVPAIGTQPDPADTGTPTPTPAPIVLWPPLDDDQLDPFGTWSPDDDMLQHLDRESHELDGFGIRPLADLRKSDQTRRGLQWTAVGGMSGVGMTMQVDTLDEDELEHLIPVLEDTPDRQSFQIGGRVIRSRGGAVVTYREQAGIRVWRILMPSQGDHTARTCYYVARAPDSAVVIRARYNPNNPDQLDAFDAAVSTLRPLEPITVEDSE